FFFQAEDGIRYLIVTGVQTCALPIYRAAAWALSCRDADGGFGHFPGSPSDADAVYFQVGTLVMAGYLMPVDPPPANPQLLSWGQDRKSTRLNSSHDQISYAVFCLKKK